MSLTAQSGIAARLVPIPPSPSFFHWTGNPGFRKGTPRFRASMCCFCSESGLPSTSIPQRLTDWRGMGHSCRLYSVAQKNWPFSSLHEVNP